jgi:hypothetical protein
MRKIGAVIIATSMLASSAFAAETAPKGPLAAGKPAGTQEAAIQQGGVMLFLGLAAVAGIIALVASTTQGDGNSTTTTTGP